MKTTNVRAKSPLFIILMAALLALTPALGQVQPVQAATCTVSSNGDSGDGTLRALLADSTCDAIDFASSMTIHLASPLVISRAVAIDGAERAVIISGDSDSDETADVRPFDITAGAAVTLQSLTVTEGVADYPKYDGGAIRNYGQLTLSGCSITGNTARDMGGGIYNGGTLTVMNTTFTGNSALGGGAIYNDTYLSDNPAAAATVTGSTFSDNISTASGPADVWTGVIGGGGAITNFAGMVTVANSTFTGNNANYAGGAVVPYLGTMNLTNNTFVGNSAPNGATIFLLDAVAGPTTLYSNLMVNGSTGANCAITTSEAPGGISGSNNLADDDSCVTGDFTGVTVVQTLSSQVDALGDHGGSTQTIPLLAGSDAIDAADDANCPATDQRGVTRPKGAGCDVGAYEYEPPTSTYSISGTLFEDLDQDGVWDTGEAGVPGVLVVLHLYYDNVPALATTTYTSGDGSYSFTGLTPLPDGYSVSVGLDGCSGACHVSRLPAPVTSLTGDLTGMDIGFYITQTTITPSSFPDGVQNHAYSQTFTVTGVGAPYAFTPSTDSPPPPGLTFLFDPYAGTMTLSGTPAEAGEFFTIVNFVDAYGSIGQLAGYVTIHPPLQASPATLPDGALGVLYNQTIDVSGGLTPYAFSDGSEGWLPDGMSVVTTSGDIVISGAPAGGGQVLIDIYVADQTGTEIEIQRSFWIKTDPSLTLSSSKNPSTQGEAVTFSLGSAATVAGWPAPWGQVTFYADGAAITDCEGLWLGADPETEEDAPNPVTCTASLLAAGTHAITAQYTAIYGPYNNAAVSLAGGQTVNGSAPEYQSGGFTAPLDLGSVLNQAKAGQMIPLKWRLLDGSGNPVIDLDPASVRMTVSPYACSAGLPADAIETYASGTTNLQNLGNGNYQLNWKTDKAWVNSCKQLTLNIGTWTGDGLTALFQFKK